MIAAHRLALGTVQWGVDGYGIANQTGHPDLDEVRAMLVAAAGAGVDTIDTAAAYGRAEDVVGRLAPGDGDWRIVTKLAPDVWVPGTDTADALAATEASLARSRRLLRRDHIDVLLLHRPVHRTCCEGAVWSLLRAERDAGSIGRLGISALTPEDAHAALDDPQVEALQVAGSLLDQRLHRSGFFEAARSSGREVHVRSTFLQGVAFLDVDALPAHLSPARPALETIDRWAAERSVPRHVAFLAFAGTLPVSRLVLGCERLDQLESNLSAVAAAAAVTDDIAALARDLPDLDASVLDPSKWPRR